MTISGFGGHIAIFSVWVCRLLFDVIVTCWHFLRARRGQKRQVCRRKCSDICHTVGDISTSGLDVHIAISGCPSLWNLFVDTFFEFAVIENFTALQLQ